MINITSHQLPTLPPCIPLILKGQKGKGIRSTQRELHGIRRSIIWREKRSCGGRQYGGATSSHATPVI
jgi:hypothetical protein